MTTRNAVRKIAVIVVLLLAATFAQPSQAAQAASRWQIKSYGGKCIDGNNATGQAYMWTCSRTSNQYFYFDLVEGLYYRLRNAKTGRCLGFDGTAGWSPTYNLACDGNWAVHWSVYLYISGPPDYYLIQPRYLPPYSSCLAPEAHGVNGIGIRSDACVNEWTSWTWYQV